MGRLGEHRQGCAASPDHETPYPPLRQAVIRGIQEGEGRGIANPLERLLDVVRSAAGLADVLPAIIDLTAASMLFQLAATEFLKGLAPVLGL